MVEILLVVISDCTDMVMSDITFTELISRKRIKILSIVFFLCNKNNIILLIQEILTRKGARKGSKFYTLYTSNCYKTQTITI